jgi:signal peptidase I
MEESKSEIFDEENVNSMDWLKPIFIAVIVAFFVKTFVFEAFRIPSGSMEDTLLPGDFIIVCKFGFEVKTPKKIPFTNFEIPQATIIPRFSPIKRGDVIVFRFPGEKNEVKPREKVNYIKRLIGLPGDMVQIKDKVIFVNGERFKEPSTVKVNYEYVVPKGLENPYIFPEGSNFNEDNYGPIIVPYKGMSVKLDQGNLKRWKILIEREGHKIDVADGKIYIDGVQTDEYVIEKDYVFVMGDNRNNSLDSRFWGFVPTENIIGRACLIYWSWDSNIPLLNLTEKIKSIRWERIGKRIE